MEGPLGRVTPRINLLEGFLKGKSQSHATLCRSFRQWFIPECAEKNRDRTRALRAQGKCLGIGATYRQRLREETFAAYGNHCQTCGELDPATLSIDHIFDDGAKERGGRRSAGTPFYAWLRRFGFPKDRYQLLCHNCQWRKRTYGPDPSTWPRFFAEV